MKSAIYLFVLLSICISKVRAQQIYDFFLDPSTTGWFYYTDLPSGGFSYAGGQGALLYEITTGTGSQFYYRDLGTILRSNYCASFKIQPYEDNYNTFFPLLLTEGAQAGPNFHPWRQNPIGQAAGPMQHLDLIGIEVYGMEIRFVHRDDNLGPADIIQSLTPSCQMINGNTYWVNLQVSNGTTAEVSVYSDPAQTQLVSSGQYTIPMLEDMTHLYIANGNGNWNTSQFGLLDDYSIDNCTLETADLLKEEDLLLFPNPASSLVSIQFPEATESQVTTRIFDQTGRIVFYAIVEIGTTVFDCPIETLTNGVYIVEISTENASIRKEMIVNR